MKPLLGPLSWNLVYVDDLAVMRDFYENVLGLPLRHATKYFAAYNTGGCTLELMARKDNGPDADSERRGWDRNRVLMSFKVERMDDVVAELGRRGAKLLHGPSPTVSDDGQPPDGQVAQFADPEGNIFELCDEALFF
ncbi:VOC family protein [Frankia sp. AgKG'84/4]|uniref:VOC family protein n=1 Tax=Frankia sp. AgKG'84/4 TaxID=573490 RepID=UPI00200D25A5|nr:VOC family protein [Frankia sp. AgKG'84/4]MCL9795390.1 VOC family protein [Frankia sp. AgKG'84/4]